MTGLLHWLAGRRASLVLLVALVLVFGVRVVAFARGWLFGDAAALYVSLGVVTVALALVSQLAYAYARAHPAVALTPASVAGGSGGAVALVLGAFTLLQLLVPATPTSAAAPACRGVPVAGSRFYAQTGPLGLNARAGPATETGQVDRYGANCTLGFDGYCLGEPIADGRTTLLDQRWLVVHRRHELVASAETLSQSPEADLGRAPDPSCTSYFPTFGSPTGVSEFRAQLAAAGVAVSVTAKSAVLVGYGVKVVDPTDGSYPYSNIRVKSNAPAFAGVYDTTTAAPSLPNGTGTVLLVAAACLAADVPVGPPMVVRVTVTQGRATAITSAAVPPPSPERDLLASTACAGPNGTNTGAPA